MKKMFSKILAFFSMLCCVFGLASCGDDNPGGNRGGTVKCILFHPAAFVDNITVSLDNATIMSLNQESTKGSVEQEIEKGKEYIITVYFERGYDVGNMGLSIDFPGEGGVYEHQVEMTKHEVEYDHMLLFYTYAYVPTRDFIINGPTAKPATWIGIERINNDSKDYVLQLGYVGHFGVDVTTGPSCDPDLDMNVRAVSSDSSIATVKLLEKDLEHNLFWLFEITAVSIGKVSIDILADSPSSASAISQLDVEVITPEHVDSLTLDKTEVILDTEVNTSCSINAMVSSDVIISARSDNSDVARVEYEYRGHTIHITAISVGTTDIIITAGDKTAICKVIVKEQPKKVDGSSGLEYTQGSYYGVNSYTLSGIGNCADSDITISNYYEDKRVVDIGYRAFAYKNTFTSVTIPEGILRIKDEAFYICSSNFKSVTLSNSVEYIGDNAFAGSAWLENINFLGTIDEWTNISKGNNWDDGTGDFAANGTYTIHCVDGTITKDGTINRY